MTQSHQSGRLDWAFWLATGLGFGYSPFAPGTVGTLWGLPLAWAISQIPGLQLQVVVIAFLLAVGIPLCTHAAQRLGKKDPGEVVWDEIATVPLTFFMVPPEMMSRPGILAVGFALHRFFDIAKVPPAKQLERLPDGLGIMADDVAAGIYSCLVLHLVLRGGFGG